MKKEFEKRILSSVFIIPIALFFVLQGSVFFLFFLGILFLVTSYEWIKMIKKNQFIKIIGFFFLFFSFYSAYQLRNYLELIVGLNAFLFIILICIFTDIGGYVVGNLIKGPKLSKISPKKTYSGMIGSFLFSIIFSYFFLKSPLLGYDKNITLEIMIFIIIISAISQFGDLVISYFKRVSKIKDTGKIIPGHGGILDRIDGILFALPLSLIILLMDIISFF